MEASSREGARLARGQASSGSRSCPSRAQTKARSSSTSSSPASAAPTSTRTGGTPARGAPRSFSGTKRWARSQSARVAIPSSPSSSAGSCRACLRGEENLCERRGLLGLDRPGVFAERVAVRGDALVPLPDELDARVGVLVEPLAASLSALRVDRVSAGDRLLVVGGGPIGLLAVYAAAQRGVSATCIEPVAERRALASRFGAERVLADARDAPAGEADSAIDAVGIEETWRAAVAGVRPGGTVALVGLGQAEGLMPVGDLVRRGVAVRGHYAYTRGDFEDALALLAASPTPFDWLTVLALAEGAEGFRRLVEEPAGVTKVLLAPR